jgi:hypothetical protein
MKARSLKLFVCGIVLASATGACLAAADTAPAANAPQSVAEILQFQHALRDKLEARSGEYSKFDESSVHRMEAAQDQVFHMLSGVTSLSQLTNDQKINLSNALDQVKATLLASENSRIICHSERKTGTNLSERHCETVGQRNANAEQANYDIYHNGIGR